jgi:hypothetical protein
MSYSGSMRISACYRMSQVWNTLMGCLMLQQKLISQHSTRIKLEIQSGRIRIVFFVVREANFVLLHLLDNAAKFQVVGILDEGGEVTFTSPNPEVYPLPNLRYLAFHAAVADAGISMTYFGSMRISVCYRMSQVWNTLMGCLMLHRDMLSHIKDKDGKIHPSFSQLSLREVEK